MKLTTKGRYAVTAMLDLALHGDQGPVSLAESCAPGDLPDLDALGWDPPIRDPRAALVAEGGEEAGLAWMKGGPEREAFAVENSTAKACARAPAMVSKSG